MGYAQAASLSGGFTAWRGATLVVATGWGAPGKRVGEEIAHCGDDLQASAGEVAVWMETGKALVVDIRPPWEHRQGHVPGAANVPAGELPGYAPAIQAAVASGRIEHVITHCAGRTRGIAAAALLRSLGVQAAQALENGCMGWLLDGRKLEFGPGPDTGLRTTLPVAVTEATSFVDPSPQRARSISAEEIEERRRSTRAFYLVDLRTPEAYLRGHIAGAVSLPAGQVLLESEAWLAIAALPIVLVGSSRAQTNWVADHLHALEFRDVAALDDGLDAWQGADKPIETGRPPLQLPAISGDASAQPISAAEFVAHPERWNVLDVRSAGEWGIGHLANSRCIPRGMLEGHIEELGDAGLPLLLVSATGLRARLARDTLSRNLSHSQDMAVLGGGINAAIAAGARIVDDAPDSATASRDTPGRITAAIWRMPLEKTRPLMLRYLAWEEALLATPHSRSLD